MNGWKGWEGCVCFICRDWGWRCFLFICNEAHIDGYSCQVLAELSSAKFDVKIDTTWHFFPISKRMLLMKVEKVKSEPSHLVALCSY